MAEAKLEDPELRRLVMRDGSLSIRLDAILEG